MSQTAPPVQNAKQGEKPELGQRWTWEENAGMYLEELSDDLHNSRQARSVK